MILEKTWMNKINLVINMRIDFLRFSNFNSISKLIALLISNELITKQKSLILIYILKRFINSKSVNQFIKPVPLVKQSIQINCS